MSVMTIRFGGQTKHEAENKFFSWLVWQMATGTRGVQGGRGNLIREKKNGRGTNHADLASSANRL